MDGLCLRSGLAGISPSVSVTGAAGERRANPSQCSAGGRSPVPANVISVFKYPFRSLLFGAKQRLKGVALDDAVLVEGNKEREECKGESEGQNGNWVLKILHVKSLWSEKEEEEEEREKEEENVELNREDLVSSNSSCDEDEKCDVCRVCGDDDEKGNVVFDRDLFSKMLKKVSLAEAKLYAQMSYLGNLAYSIPSIKPGNLLKRHGLRYVTSSIEKREQLAFFDKKEQPPSSEEELSSEPETSVSSPVDTVECEGQKDETSRTRASAAFEIAASAASYLHSGTRSMLPFRGSKTKDGENLHDTVDGGTENVDINSEMASLMATTDSVTAVVAAKEEVKQAVADDLNSMSSSPCEWYICDDDQNATRFFVIQGSESLSSWQANLLFEPVQFEGMDVFVHRGIYEAAKGIYQQMLPEVHAHLKSHGKHARFRFTGHSLGGSLSLLISLMLLIRGEVPSSSLLPVITFGSPHVMCGGDDLLRQLGLPRNYVQAVTMHRDIVPRAFSCNYPRPAAQILKAVNGNFRNHPCLNNQKLLYAPMGELLILQPDSNFSPQHDLLPSGSGLYLLNSFTCDDIEPEKLLRAAKLVFLNNPHPLEILSDRSSYGNDGAILRDHDMRSYLKTVRGVIRHELNRIRKAHRERRTKVWWPHVTPRLVHAGVVLMGTASFGFSGAVRTGRESLKRFSRLIASQHMHMLVVLIGAYSVIGFR